jgi:hypothetical protein
VVRTGVTARTLFESVYEGRGLLGYLAVPCRELAMNSSHRNVLGLVDLFTILERSARMHSVTIWLSPVGPPWIFIQDRKPNPSNLSKARVAPTQVGWSVPYHVNLGMVPNRKERYLDPRIRG